MAKTIAQAIYLRDSPRSDSARYALRMDETALYALRRERLRLLKVEAGNTVVQLATRLKRDKTQVSQWLNAHRNISESSARDIEQKMRKPRLWLDAPLAAPVGSVAEERVTAIEPIASPMGWPFSVEYHRLLKLGPADRRAIDKILVAYVRDWEESHAEAQGARTA